MAQRTALALLTSTLSTALGKSLARRTLEDAGLFTSQSGEEWLGRASPLTRLGLETMRGDRAFLLDWNETSDDDLASVGVSADAIAAIRAAVSRRARDAPRHSRFDRREAAKLTSQNPLMQFLARARLSVFFHSLSRLGVLALVDLLDVTDDDLDTMKMMRVPRRRFRRALQARLPGTTADDRRTNVDERQSTATELREATTHGMGSGVVELLVRTVRLPPPEITCLASYHGVESLQDLHDVTEDMLRDIGAKPLHRRRFEAARTHLSRASSDRHLHANSSTLSCNQPHATLLSKVRLGRFAEVLSTQLGVRRICQLLELQRPDLIAAGLRTLHRRRLYAAVSLYAACSPRECEDSEASRKDRQVLRLQGRARLLQQLGRWPGFRGSLNAASSPGDRAPALAKRTVLFNEETGVPPGPARIIAAHGSNWAPWTTKSLPWHDQGGHGCMFGALRLPGLKEQNMCLNPNDHLSSRVAHHGRWRDCSQLVDEWNRPSRRTDSWWSPGTFLELGANIGVCTMEMLLRTSARAVAFEPSTQNIFYLTKSMSMAAAERPGMANRLVVFPVGVGDVPRRSTMMREKGNFGNSHLNAADGQSADEEIVDLVDVYTIDSLFPQLPLLEPVRLMKLDVQGFECRALGGALSVLLSGSVQSIIAETSKMLRRQNCSANQMRAFLRNFGFSIVATGASGIFTGNEATTVARVNP